MLLALISPESRLIRPEFRLSAPPEASASLSLCCRATHASLLREREREKEREEREGGRERTREREESEREREGERASERERERERWLTLLCFALLTLLFSSASLHYNFI